MPLWTQNIIVIGLALMRNPHRPPGNAGPFRQKEQPRWLRLLQVMCTSN